MIKKNYMMDQKRITVRVNAALAEELIEFCRRGRATQEGVVEAAIYWLVRRMPREEYWQLMDAATAYLDGQGDESADGRPIGEQVGSALDRGAAKRRKGQKRIG